MQRTVYLSESNLLISSTPPFILRLVSRFKKEKIICKAQEIRPTAEKMGGDSKARIYYNDHLTARNHEILISAKRLWDDYIIWTRNGQVHADQRNKEAVDSEFIRWMRSSNCWKEKLKELSVIQKRQVERKEQLMKEVRTK